MNIPEKEAENENLAEEISIAEDTLEPSLENENEKESTLKYRYNSDGSIEEIIKFNVNNEKEKLYKYVYEYSLPK